MDHILENESKPVPSLDSVAESAGGSSAPMDVDDDDEETALLKAQMGAAEGVEAKSIKCSQCGKIFKNTALANFHAEKSGHDQFEESTEEIKPLTEEEKQERLAELRAKMAEKRARKAVVEAEENKANEALRRKAGKDMNKIKEELQAKEAIKEAEQKRREKIEDAKARAAVKAQIEADKKARAEKAAREKALREGNPLPGDGGSSTAPAAATNTTASASSGVAGRDFKDTRLQIRMSTGGQPYTTTLPSDARECFLFARWPFPKLYSIISLCGLCILVVLLPTRLGRDVKSLLVVAHVRGRQLPILRVLSIKAIDTHLYSNTALREVAEFVAAQNLAVNAETVTLAQHFPRKTFERSDFSKTLRELGLTPSAVLIATP
ncbi:hypothetical protein VNI00_000024 [Paramarasmius palmivorus]|uniref:UBX domain-containing protein n=1 Tax=Paramarasmius palmivorus TaxID=297713 RepID=A0AAW0EBU2_9AGAR